MRLFSTLTALCFCIIGSSAIGQNVGVNPSTIPAGTRARIVEAARGKHSHALTVINADQDSLRFHYLRDREMTTLSWNDVIRMEVTTGRHSNFWKGFGIGLLVGAASGALIGSSSASGNDGYTPTAVGTMGAIGGAVLGGLGGGLLGIVWRTDKWVPVAVPAHRSSHS